MLSPNMSWMKWNSQNVERVVMENAALDITGGIPFRWEGWLRGVVA